MMRIAKAVLMLSFVTSACKSSDSKIRKNNLESTDAITVGGGNSADSNPSKFGGIDSQNPFWQDQPGSKSIQTPTIDGTAKPAEDVAANLSYSVSNDGGVDENCPKLRSFVKSTNSFRIEIEAIAAVGGAGDFDVSKNLCTFTGKIIIPAGYIVNIALNSGTVSGPVFLGSKDEFLVKSLISYNFGSSNFGSNYAIKIAGPFSDSFSKPLIQSDGTNLTKCSDARSTTSELSFKIAFKYTVKVDIDTTEEPAGMEVLEFPEVIIEPKKCI